MVFIWFIWWRAGNGEIFGLADIDELPTPDDVPPNPLGSYEVNAWLLLLDVTPIELIPIYPDAFPLEYDGTMDEVIPDPMDDDVICDGPVVRGCSNSASIRLSYK